MKGFDIVSCVFLSMIERLAFAIWFIIVILA